MRRFLLVAFLVLTVALVGCAPATTGGVTPTQGVTPESVTTPQVDVAPTASLPEAGGALADLPAVDPGAVTGDIVIAGSSTVYPLSERIAERFRDEGYTGNVTIDSIGSGAGFERFCTTGETDIANASRPIKESETEACRAIGREPVELRVGTDALAVVVSAENDFIENVTLAELAAIYSGGAENWSDVNPEWPDEAIQRFSPGTDSGTFDYFVEVVMGDNAETILAAPNLQLSEDDNILVRGVLGSPYAIGYFGYAYYQENADSLHALTIEGVEPSATTVEDASYPLARPLFLYTAASIMSANPQVAEFTNYFLQTVDEEIDAVGYFPASDEALSDSAGNWLQATGR